MSADFVPNLSPTASRPPRLVFPPRKQVIAEVRAFVEETLKQGQAPVLLASAFGALPALVLDLAHAGIPTRAHARVAAVLARLRGACEGLPLVPRFAGKLAAGEVLLWPPEARDNASLRGVGNPCLALVSGSAADPEMLARMRVRRGFALTNMASFPEILAIIEATGAREVALYHGSAATLAALLRARGHQAYALEPPRQMTLPGS